MQDQLCDVSDVFDLLLSMGDFMAFKEVMLAYRKEAQTVGHGSWLEVGPAVCWWVVIVLIPRC